MLRIFQWSSALAISLGLLVSGAAGTTYAAEAPGKKVAVAYPSVGPFFLWFLLEKELGFYRQEGLLPEFILVRGGGLSVKGLIAGNFDYIHNTGAALEAIVLGRPPLKLVFTAAKAHYWLMAQPGIRSVADLKGKSIATGGLGSITEVIVREILKKHGLDPFKDAVLIGAGAPQERLAAMVSGTAQAAVLVTPFDLKAAQMGYQKIAKVTDYVRWPAAGIATREETIARQPSEVYKIVLAALKGLKLVLSQRDYVHAKLIQMFRLSSEEAARIYEELREEVFVPSGYLAEEDQLANIAIMKQAGGVKDEIPPERVFDYRFVRQAEQELKGWTPKIPR
ncbi:MAG TPA: ABC transporter substrate-binding protein [Candidatus Binatia bacterium]